MPPKFVAPPKPPTAPPVKPPVMAKPLAAAAPAKMFAVTTRQSSDFGKKIVLYGMSGAGKTSLASLAPDPIFVDLDRGLTDPTMRVIDGITSFADLRAVAQQATRLVPAKGTLILDTVSKMDELLTAYLITSKNVSSIFKLGFDRFPMAVESFRLLLTDLDQVIASGRNVILSAHSANISVANALGLNYEQEGPKLTHSRNDSCRDEMVAWADHVFRIAYEEAVVEKDTEKAKAGKVRNASTVRQIYTEGSAAMLAKSRPVNGQRLPAVISFEGPTDDSLWQFLFHGAMPQTETAT